MCVSEECVRECRRLSLVVPRSTLRSAAEMGDCEPSSWESAKDSEHVYEVSEEEEEEEEEEVVLREQ